MNLPKNEKPRELRGLESVSESLRADGQQSAGTSSGASRLSMIKIVDYGMGNLRSVQKAFEKLGHEALVCDQAAQLGEANKLVLPGVGAFRDAIHELRRKDMVAPILDH